MNWVNVKDNLPTYEKRVLTVCSDKVQRVLVCDMFEDMIDWYDEEWGGFDDGVEVEHWRELPEAPYKITQEEACKVF